MKRIQLLLLLAFMLPFAGQAMAQDCTNPDGDIGVLAYNDDYGVLQVCTAQNWIGLNPIVCPAGDRCAGTADAFAFADVTDAETSTLIESNIIQISGLAAAGIVSITGDGTPEFRVCSSADCSTEITPWGSTDQDIHTGDYLQLRLTSSASESTLHSASVTINGTSDQWDVTTGISGPVGCENIGDQCPDGSFYIGNSPADGTPVFMTSSTYEVTRRWDNNSGCYHCGDAGWVTGNNSGIDGKINVAALKAWVEGNTADGDLNGFDAARYCDDLSAHTHSDWYLPASNPTLPDSELDLLWLMIQEVGNPVDGIGGNANWYWSSRAFSTDNAYIQRFSDGGRNWTQAKRIAYRVRCFRR